MESKKKDDVPSTVTIRKQTRIKVDKNQNTLPEYSRVRPTKCWPGVLMQAGDFLLWRLLSN